MIYTQKIKDAILFAIETHELNKKQKRKGKDVPYITHPFTVGIILSLVGAREELVISGILHDTIEDSDENKKVSKEMIENKFGLEVSKLVVSVTEEDKALSWDERKKTALEHIKNFSNDSVLLKSADIISNVSELKDDFDRNENKIFESFSQPKEKTLKVYENVIKALIKKWPQNPLIEDLNIVLKKICKMY